MRVLITGSRGFIGKNLGLRLMEMGGYEILEYNRNNSPALLPHLIEEADSIVHLAGEMRPVDNNDYLTANVDLTKKICAIIKESNTKKMLLLSSSIQAEQDNPYGLSKSLAESEVKTLSQETGSPVVVFRLPHVFGKWCKPNYNSVIATFCYNISRGLPIKINDPDALIRPVYIDDVVSEFIKTINIAAVGFSWRRVQPEYQITVGELAQQIMEFKDSRDSLISARTGVGLTRALYSTYMSYLPAESFLYEIPMHCDARGIFVEILKTLDTGQFSYFTAFPGVTRGGHYHHTKSEKFLVVSGKARFCFRHIVTNECHVIYTSSDKPQVVETIPGWAHDITNVGNEEMIVLLWANEIFDREKPDTIACKV